MAKSLQDYIDEKERKQTASSSSSEEKNQGGFWGGAEYLGTRLVDGLVSNVEGIVDFTVGGLADLFGADKFAERQFANDWYNYNRADEKYNPGKGMSVAGDIVGVVGGALPDIGIGLITGGAGLGAKLIGKGISLGTSFASSAGRGVSEAVGKTGELGGKEWAGGLGSGGLAAGIEAASGGLGDLFGGVFGKTGVEMGSELAESFGKKASAETVGNIFGKIAGKEAAGEVSEGAGKKLISKLWNSKFGKELLGEMASEGIEEGLETWIEPEIIQGTYDPTRPNATIGDIAYSAMLGGLGGGLISGGLGGISGAVNKTRLTTRGGTISNDSTKLNNLMHNAEVIANYENNKQTGSQIFSQVESLYNDVKASLEKNGGKVTLATMENIGRLDALVAASTVQPSIVNAAKGIAKNAESMAAALNNFYSRNGQSSNITAEQLTAGLKLKGTSQEFVASVTDALNTNPTFRQVVMNNMLGNMEFDAQSYARSIYGDMDIRNIATQQNLNRFLSTADAATLGKAGEALGITDWSRVTPEELAQRIYDYRDSGRAELTREGISAVREAKEAQGYTNGMPTSLSALTEGATRFQSPGADFAIVRHGNSYRLYDYETGKITNAMIEGDMAALVQRIKDRQAEIGRQSEMQALDRELDNFANENVPEYKKLSEGEKEAVRATLRYARANGISLKDQILFARIAAKSGMNIIVKQKLEDGKAAWFDGVNSIYLDANSPRTRGFKGLLGHEMFHKLFKNDTDRKLFKKAYDAVPEAERDEIEARYTDMYEKLNVHSEQEIQDISSEEVAAAYAEELFNTPDVWSYILDGEPSIKDKVLAFFGKAPERYDFAKEMEPAAREWLQEYKQLFDSVAEYNAGGTLAADVGTTLRTERTIQRVGKVVDNNTPENANKKSASGTKAQDSGERFAFMGVAEDGRSKYQSNFPKGTPKSAKSQRILDYISKVWSKKPISLVISNGITSRTIEAQFDPTIDPNQNIPTDASKLAAGNRHGTSSEKRVTLDLADDYYQIASEAKYNYSKEETGKTTGTHKDVKMWHYFVDDIYFAEYGEDDYSPYTVTINIKEKPDGTFVYSFNAEKAEESSTRRTLHAGVNTRKGANGELFVDSISQKSQNDKGFDKKSAKDFNSGERSALADGKKATTSDVAAAKRAIRESGIDPSGIIAVADKYFDRYGGELTRTGVRYEFLGAAETMLEDDAGAMERAYAKIEALADELTYNEKNANSLREDLDQIKRHVREITFEIRDKDKGEFDSLGGYNEFRKKHFGKLKIGSEGASIDSTYGELQNQYGTSFFPEVNTVAEMLIRIGDVVDMDPNFETESDIDLEAARNDMAVAITGELGSAFDKKLAAKAEKLSKSDAEAYKARITARAETKAAKEIARAKKRLEKIEAKLRAQAEKQIADAGKKLNEALETERTKLTAEYETDKVFSQSSVKNNLGTVDAFKTLPAAERSEISRRVWKDFSESNGYDSREWLVIKYSAELVDTICKAKPEAVSKYERDAIADQVNAALKKIAAGGKTSVRGRMEGELREEIKAQESVKRELLSDIYQELKKIDDVKTARFVAASDYKGADFKGSINSLTKMDWRGRLNDSIVRSEMKNLLSWYHPDNPMLKGFESGDFKVTNYDQGIKERLDLLANGQGELSNTELSMLADTLRYFTKLVGEYDSVYVEGKWQSGEKLVYQMRDNIEKQNKMKVPMAVWALRNRVLSGDLRAFADPLSVMKLADMYEDGIFTKVYKDWMQGEINADAEALNIKSEYDAFMKGNRKYLARAEKDTVTLHGVEINRLQLVSYVMTLKRKGSWLGVASDGVVFRDKNGRDVAMRAIVPIDNGPGFNKKLEAAIKAEQGIAERLLTNKDKEYMQILERGFEKAKVTKAAGDMQRLGFVNVVDGYYYPIKRAYTEHISEFEAELLATDRYANASFNKKTIERAKSALLISSADSVFNSHINGVTGYMYLSPVMDSFNKLYKLKALKTKPGDGADIGALYALPGSTFSLQSLIGQSPSTWRQDGKVVGFDYLQNLMLDTMGGRTRLVGDDWAGKLRAGYVGFALGGNIKTMATQLSSMFASTSVLQPFNHLKSVVSWRGGMDNYSTVAKLRDSDYTILKSTAVTDQVNRFAAWFTKGMSLMDRLVVYRAWNAAQMQVAQKGGPKLGTEENLIAAGKLLDKVILETQQNAFTSRKTEAARRGNSIVKAMIMFKSDAITTQGRIIDAWGELQYLTATKKGVEAESKAEAKKQIKTAKKQLSKAVGAVVASSAYMVAIAELFRAFYGKLDKDEEDEEKATRLRGEFILNALGGIPVISAIAEAFSSSYDFESMEFSAINDILDTAKQCRDYFDDLFAGKATERDGLKMIERALYGAGQLFGIPLRNLKNLSYGITRLISPEAAYKWDSALYSQTYGKDLTDALEKEDYQMAEVILETAFGEKMGSGLSDDAIKVLSRLAKNGENVIPSAVSDKITIDGEERELTGEELKAVREKYGEAVEQINKIIQTDVFRDFDDEMKADAVRKIYDLYKNLAYDGAVGSKKDEEAYLLSKVVDADVLCLNEILSIYTADVDENGKTVSGSKRGKVIAAISDMDISDEEKLLLIATQGYALKDDDIYGMSKEKADELLFDYIASLDLSDEERLALYKYAGYDVKDGEVSGSAASGSSGSATSGSSGSSKKSFSGSLANPSGILYKATKNRARRIGKIV